MIIKTPSTGIAQSPFTGFPDCRNLDIYSVPGIVKLNNLLSKESGDTVVGLIKWIVQNPATPAEIYALDDGGKVYKSADSGDSWALMTGFTAGGHGNGLAIFKNYLIVARDAYLDVCGDGTAAGITNANWTNSWKVIDSDILWHPMIISDNDGKLYGGAERYVFSLEELTTFAPATADTYTWTQQALDLPANKRIKCLTELGNNLELGTWVGTNVYDTREAFIYPWDRSSVTFGQPVKISEHGIHGLLTDGGIMYVLAGIGGTIYKSDGVNYTQIAQIPASIADLDGGSWIQFFPGAIIKHKDRTFFGVSSGSGNIDGMGIWSLKETSQGTILTLEHSVSTGNYGTAAALQVGALLQTARDIILAGWRDGTNFGIDRTQVASRVTSYGGYFLTPFYQVGTNGQKTKFSEIEFQLAKPLRTNEGIKIAYRTNLIANFTDLGTFDYSTWGGELSHNAIFNKGTTSIDIPACEFIQLKISLTGVATTPEKINTILK